MDWISLDHMHSTIAAKLFSHDVSGMHNCSDSCSLIMKTTEHWIRWTGGHTEMMIQMSFI